MAKIVINSASAYISTEKRNNVFLSSALVTYNVNANWAERGISDSTPATGGGTGSNITHIWYTYSYTDLSYDWEFNTVSSNLSSGNIAIGGLNQGQKNIISCNLTISGTETVTIHRRTDTRTWIPEYKYNEDLNPGPAPADNDPHYTEWETQYQEYVNSRYDDGGWSNWTEGTETSTSTNNPKTASWSTTIPAYTRPGSFTDYNFSQNTVIQSAEGLTATKVDNWIDHCNAYAHWYNQDNNDVTSATCQVSFDDLITADWYNACINSIPGLTSIEKNNYVDSNPPGLKVHGGATGTIITAGIINLLGTRISKDDT